MKFFRNSKLKLIHFRSINGSRFFFSLDFLSVRVIHPWHINWIFFSWMKTSGYKLHKKPSFLNQHDKANRWNDRRDKSFFFVLHPWRFTKHWFNYWSFVHIIDNKTMNVIDHQLYVVMFNHSHPMYIPELFFFLLIHNLRRFYA